MVQAIPNQLISENATMSQLKIDQLFKIVEKTRISDDNKNDLPSAKVDVAEVTVSVHLSKS